MECEKTRPGDFAELDAFDLVSLRSLRHPEMRGLLIAIGGAVGTDVDDLLTC